MSVSLIEQLAAMLQGNTNNVAAKPQVAVDVRPIVKGSAFELIRRLATKKYDGEAVVTDKDGSVVEFDDGSPVTFGDLATVENVRPDGSAGRHYPLVWALTQSQGSAAIEYLGNLPDKPKQASAGRRQNTSAAKPQNDDLIKQLIAAIAAMQTDISDLQQPAKPVPTIGHRKVAAKPQSTDVGNGEAVVNLVDGQIVAFGNELWQVTTHGNGRPALRKTIV